MIFLRTTSKAFGNFKKGTTFRSGLQQSFQFGGHRASIANSPFSYYIDFTAGYTFVQQVSVTSDMPFWRLEASINYDKCAESLFAGIGLVVAQYSFDGSGDSGDFNEDDLNFSHALNMNTLLNSAGLLDSTDPNHCLHLRSPANRFFQNGTLTQTRGGTRPACDSLEYAAYNALETQYGGWENNAGANGHVTIVQGDEVSIEYNEGSYTCERCDEEYDDHSSCSCKKCPECFDYVDEDTNECECCGKVVHNCKGKGCSSTTLGDEELCRYCKKEIAADK
jgi:hypothetical protein